MGKVPHITNHNSDIPNSARFQPPVLSEEKPPIRRIRRVVSHELRFYTKQTQRGIRDWSNPKNGQESPTNSGSFNARLYTW